MQSCGVRRPSVCPSVCKHFAQIASSTTEMAGSPPNLHMMVPRRACIQVCSRSRSRSKVTWFGHICDVTKCLLYSTVSRSVSTRAHFMKEAPLHSPSIRIRQLDLMYKSWNELLRHWRSIVVSLNSVRSCARSRFLNMYGTQRCNSQIVDWCTESCLARRQTVHTDYFETGEILRLCMFSCSLIQPNAGLNRGPIIVILAAKSNVFDHSKLGESVYK